MHPHTIGHRSRIVVLERLIQYMLSRPDVWFATHEPSGALLKGTRVAGILASEWLP